MAGCCSWTPPLAGDLVAEGRRAREVVMSVQRPTDVKSSGAASLVQRVATSHIRNAQFPPIWRQCPPAHVSWLDSVTLSPKCTRGLSNDAVMHAGRHEMSTLMSIWLHVATGCQTCSRGRFHEMHHLGQGTLGLKHELASLHISFVVQLRYAVSDSSIKRLHGSPVALHRIALR